MSLMGTLAKVAVGVAVAKGASGMLSKGGLGGLLGGGGAAPAQAGGGLENMLGGLLGGQAGAGQSGGGLGGLLEGLQQQNPRTQDGGLDDLLGGLASGQGDMLGGLMKTLGGGQSAGGGLGGMLGGLAGGGGLAALAGGTAKGGGFGDLLNQAFERGGEPEAQPSADQDAVAGLMLRALIQSAMSDGKIDEAERQKLMDNLGEVSAEERAFVQAEMQRPVDGADLAGQVPPGLERQVYTMSLLGIDLDNQNEAQYLHTLAGAMGLDQSEVNEIHAQLGAPALYR